MAPGSHARGEGLEPRPRRRGAWAIGTPVVALACGALFVVSALDSQGTDLRPGRYTDLASLVEAESDDYAALEARAEELQAEVKRLAGDVSTVDDTEWQRRADRLRDPAGLTPRTGPGVSVTLSDAPADVINSTTQDIDLLVVHQQDIQAVVNALWKGGASAVTIEGQRVITTTGIKCAGNSVQLGGVPYPQPYDIAAVGDPGDLVSALEADPYLKLYREQAAQPDISVGWDLEVESRVVAPAYEGLATVSYAEPVR